MKPKKLQITMQQPDLKILICGGGTGGHVFPAIAIADAIRELAPQSRIQFVGARGRLEMTKVPAAGYPIKSLWISGFQRRFSLQNILFPVKLVFSLVKSAGIIMRFRPNLVIGVGGYSSGPPLWIAHWMGIPMLIQEQNSYPGITNRILGPRATRICVAYPGMDRHFPAEKIVITGNPVRREVAAIEGKRKEAATYFGLDDNLRTVLAVGGSLGAATINASMKACLEELRKDGLQVIWQTGKNYYEDVAAFAKGKESKGLVIRDFIGRMDLAYAMADLVVSRAGAIAISEISITGRALILVPSPNVSEDHQTKNARALADKGAAILIPDSDAPEQLGRNILELLKSPGRMYGMQQNIREFARPGAGRAIAEQAIDLAQKRKKIKA